MSLYESLKTMLPVRHRFVCYMLVVVLTPSAVSAVKSDTVTSAATLITSLERRAEQLSRVPFQPSPELPQSLRRLDYDYYRLIAFEPQRAAWRGSATPFQLEFFHRGYIYRDDVTIHLGDNDRYQTLPFDSRMFQYRGRLQSLTTPQDLGFAGFRVIGKFESSADFLELASFLGASYFRAIGSGQVYGTSARGLAIDVGLPKPEEFPVFREFWIERPANNADSLTFAALLDGPSVTGAYQFTLRPGSATTFDVQVKLFFRHRPEKIGIAPMSSMWMWGDGRPVPENDRRPEVHDCDGLLVHTTDDEWIWRSLTRLDYPSLSRFEHAGIRGFGLIQRDRTPAHYADAEAKYDLRPSVWIEPKSPWTDGAVELLELPADHEGIDNIAAWWTPKGPVDASKPLELEYSVSFQSKEPSDPKLCRVATFNPSRRDDGTVRIEVDFASTSSTFSTTEFAVVPEVSVQRAELLDATCEERDDGMIRLTLVYRPHGDEAVEVQAVLKSQDKPISETWRYLCRI